MPRERSLMLRVKEALLRDVGKGRARISIRDMKKLDLNTGDVIKIIGAKETSALAWPIEDTIEGGIIMMDGQIRKNAGVSLNEYVTVKKDAGRVAKYVALVPLMGKYGLEAEFSRFIKNRLIGMPLTEGNDVTVMILGNPIPFNVYKVIPKSTAKVGEETKLEIIQEAKVKKKPSGVTYEDIGGLKEQLEKLREMVELPLKHPEVFNRLGIKPPSGVLLYGPPGCGKTLIAKALANECSANFYTINGPEIMNKYYGESEAKLREIFKEAKKHAPSIIFIDEIDAIAPKREEVFGDVEKRIVAQLLALMDGLTDRDGVIVIGATNRIDSIDPALRRPGRFDREVEIGVPNEKGRLEILQIHTRGMPLAKNVSLRKLAKILYGYTGADIKALCIEAAIKALKRYMPNVGLDEKVPQDVLERMEVRMKDFLEAKKEIRPSALREFYVERPDVGWKDVGGLEDVKKALEENVVWAIKSPEDFERMGIKPPSGVLLYGPPGCGKTLIAKALANECDANLISIRGPEILSKWVGESERAVREAFRKAKQSAPCIVFFDEIDSVARVRGGLEDFVGERVVSQLLTELDGIYSSGVFFVAATNRPDVIDPSLIRPGRLDLLLYVGPPDERARREIFERNLKRMPIDEDVEVERLASATKGYSGADIDAVCREAGLSALRRGAKKVSMGDFERALSSVRPSLSPELLKWYESIHEVLKRKLISAGKEGMYA